MKRIIVSFGTIATLGLMGAAPLHAAPIVYTANSIASGTLGGVPFLNALVTVTLVGDTSGVVEWAPSYLPGVLFNEGSATVTVDGVGTATFNDPNGYATLQFPGLGLFIAQFDNAEQTSFTGILGLSTDSLSYDLQSAFGPLTGVGIGVATHPDGSFVEYSTTSGALQLTSGGDQATFAAAVAATPVPEPGSLSLFVLGAFGAIAARRRIQL